MDGARRRRVLRLGGVTLLSGLAGCSALRGGDDDENNIQDTDGDGVIDSEDYAPRDPEIQREEQVENESSQTEEGSQTETEPDEPDTATGLNLPLRAGFEDQTVAPFEQVNDANWEPSSATAHDGEYSIRIQSQTTPQTDPDLRWELPGTGRPDRIRFHFYEYENQQNGAIAFLNEDEEIVSGGGTNNPNWTVWRRAGASGENWYQGDGYERWVRFTFDFDWERSEIMLTGEDLASGTTRQTIAHFLTQDPISSVVISSNNFQAGNSGYNVASSSSQGNPKSMHFDEIEIL